MLKSKPCVKYNFKYAKCPLVPNTKYAMHLVVAPIILACLFTALKVCSKKREISSVYCIWKSCPTTTPPSPPLDRYFLKYCLERSQKTQCPSIRPRHDLPLHNVLNFNDLKKYGRIRQENPHPSEINLLHSTLHKVRTLILHRSIVQPKKTNAILFQPYYDPRMRSRT